MRRLTVLAKRFLPFILLCYLSSALAGKIVLSLTKDPADKVYHHFEVDTYQRGGKVQKYVFKPGESTITIDTDYSKCTYYLSYSVDEDGVRSNPTSIREFRVQKGKIVPCLQAPITKETSLKSAVQQ